MIKRIFRGNKNLQGTSVTVEGLGNKNFCVSRPRLQDTRIFFVSNLKIKDYKLDKLTIRHFRLRSSLLRPTRDNIQILSGLNKQSPNTGKITIPSNAFIDCLIVMFFYLVLLFD